MIYNSFYKKSKITCFAYGQTGSGKTYTLFGNLFSSSYSKKLIFGILPLAGYDIFKIISNERKFNNFEIFVSFFEIYCDKLYDLLNNRNKLEIREDSNGLINIIGLKENRINSLENLIKIINLGGNQRTVGKTGANIESSRSHGIIQLIILDTHNDTQHSKINFIDLAGSERESDKINVDKKTRIDGAAINQSLFSLKECIRALEHDKLHIPFRGSKLTLVLRDSFIGNCKTLMISTISPGYKASEQSLNTLRYSYRLKEIKNFANNSKCLELNGNKSLSKKNIFVKNDPNQQIGNMLNNYNFKFHNSSKTNNIKCSNNNNKNAICESKNKNEKNIFYKLDKKCTKRRKSYSDSNSPKKDSDSEYFRKKKTIRYINDTNNVDHSIKIKSNNKSFVVDEKKKNKSKKTLLSNNISTSLQYNNGNNTFNIFSKNNINMTNKKNVNNVNPFTMGNHNNLSCNFLEVNNNSINFSNNGCLSYQNNIFKKMAFDELEKKNKRMNEDLANHVKVVKNNQQLHINSMCELLRMEITIFQKYKDKQTDIKTYIENMNNILNSQKGQYNIFYKDLEKLNYLKEEQIKLSKEIEKMRQNEINKLDFQDKMMIEDNFSDVGEKNNLRDLENTPKENNTLGRQNCIT